MINQFLQINIDYSIIVSNHLFLSHSTQVIQLIPLKWFTRTLKPQRNIYGIYGNKSTFTIFWYCLSISHIQFQFVRLPCCYLMGTVLRFHLDDDGFRGGTFFLKNQLFSHSFLLESLEILFITQWLSQHCNRCMTTHLYETKRISF